MKDDDDISVKLNPPPVMLSRPSSSKISSNKVGGMSAKPFYEDMMKNVHQILAHNESFDSTASSSHHHISNDNDDTWSNCSNGRRSSCSNTPSSESHFNDISSIASKRENLAFGTATKASKSSHVNQRNVPNWSRKHLFDIPQARNDPPIRQSAHLLCTEQSFYVDKMASKYRVHPKSDVVTDEVVFKSMYSTTRTAASDHRTKPRKKHVSKAKQSLEEPEEEYDLYGLSPLNASIATRNYLQKYGLTSSSNGQQTEKKTKVQNTNHNRNHIYDEYEPLLEADDESEDRSESNSLVREIKSRTGGESR